MNTARKPFRREAEDQRRHELVEATLASIAELGLEHTTVREIAVRAGVTPGLIRHYFEGKDELVIAAYRHHVNSMAQASTEAVERAGPHPAERLAAFVAANLSPPILDPANLALWASFMTLVRSDPRMAAVHEEGYFSYRNQAETLSAAARAHAGKPCGPSDVRHLGIALNALIDGLWLEGSLSDAEFAEGELALIGLRTASAITGINLINKDIL